MATTEKQRYYPTSQQPQIFQPADAPQQTAVEQHKANIFANWGQNGQGNWARTSNPGASQWADRTMKDMNIGQKTNQPPIVVPYEAGTRVVQQPVVQQQTQTTPVQRVQQPIRSMEDLAEAMGYTSPEQEEKLRKASVANQRILAIGDALRQIGNIYNTTRYAPSQQFNSPVEIERQRYLQGKMLRDKANQTYISYQQAKAKQDAQQRQWEAEQKQKADQWNLNFKYNAARDAANLAEKQRQYDSNLALNKEKEKRAADQFKMSYDQKERQHKQSQAVQWYNDKTSRMNAERMARNGGSGKEERRDTRRGYLTKRGASAGEIEATYHQMYEWGKQHKDPRTGKPYIDENALKGQMTYGTYSFGGSSSISQDLKERAVNQMLMEHDDAAVLMHDKYGWEWHEQKPNDKRNNYSQYIVQPSGGTSGGADYSKYIRK